ncbi:MAG: hypothetical protein AB1489_02735 [Acidobacteriota bacterium]
MSRKQLVIILLLLTTLFCSTTTAQLKGKIARRVNIDFRPEAMLVLPDGTGFIATELPYQMIHWDFKLMKPLGATASRAVATAALIHDHLLAKVYRISYQGIEIYNAASGEAEGEMRPFRSTVVGGVFDAATGRLVVVGRRSVFFVDPESRQMLAETLITTGNQMATACLTIIDRRLYVAVQTGADNQLLAIPVDLDRYTAGVPISLGEKSQTLPLTFVMRPGQEEFYLSGSESKGAARLFVKALSVARGEFSRLFLQGLEQPPQLVFSANGRHLVAYGRAPLAKSRRSSENVVLGNLVLIAISTVNDVILASDDISDPRGVAFSPDGEKLYVFDGEGHIFTIN